MEAAVAPSCDRPSLAAFSSLSLPRSARLPILPTTSCPSITSSLRTPVSPKNLCCKASMAADPRVPVAEVNEFRLNQDLEQTWEVLAEPMQTVMRRYAVSEPYEKLKELTRGMDVTKESIREFIEGLDLPQESKSLLLDLTPQSYFGEAKNLAKAIDDIVDLENGFKLL